MEVFKPIAIEEIVIFMITRVIVCGTVPKTESKEFSFFWPSKGEDTKKRPKASRFLQLMNASSLEKQGREKELLPLQEVVRG